MPNGRSTRAQLLERLRAGPLHSEEWRGIASSRGGLRVRISQLRRDGYVIAADPQPRLCGARGRRRPSAYRLVREPA